MTTDRRTTDKRIVLRLLDPRSPTLDQDIDEFYAALMQDVARARQSADQAAPLTKPAEGELEAPETE
jgi:hypothetical protein